MMKIISWFKSLSKMKRIGLSLLLAVVFTFTVYQVATAMHFRSQVDYSIQLLSENKIEEAKTALRRIDKKRRNQEVIRLLECAEVFYLYENGYYGLCLKELDRSNIELTVEVFSKELQDIRQHCEMEVERQEAEEAEKRAKYPEDYSEDGEFIGYAKPRVGMRSLDARYTQLGHYSDISENQTKGNQPGDSPYDVMFWYDDDETLYYKARVEDGVVVEVEDFRYLYPGRYFYGEAMRNKMTGKVENEKKRRERAAEEGNSTGDSNSSREKSYYDNSEYNNRASDFDDEIEAEDYYYDEYDGDEHEDEFWDG